jgi:preprotein translocase subunit YajC
MLGVVPAATQRLDSADALPPDRHSHPETQADFHTGRAKERPTVNPVILIFIVMIGAMILMTRSARNKQRQAAEMRNQMEPGSGIRTIGGMYAVVKEVNDETVLLEITDGVHAHFAKNAISAVLSEDEFNRIVHGIEPEEIEGADGDAAAGDAAATDGADDAHATAEDGEQADAAPIDLSKSAAVAESATSEVEVDTRGSDAKTSDAK